jgi:hypothetical protein
MLYSHLRPGFHSGLLPSGLPTKMLYVPLTCPMRATCPAHLILLALITLTHPGNIIRCLKVKFSKSRNETVHTLGYFQPKQTYRNTYYNVATRISFHYVAVKPELPAAVQCFDNSRIPRESWVAVTSAVIRSSFLERETFEPGPVNSDGRRFGRGST